MTKKNEKVCYRCVNYFICPLYEKYKELGLPCCRWFWDGKVSCSHEDGEGL